MHELNEWSNKINSFGLIELGTDSYLCDLTHFAFFCPSAIKRAGSDPLPTNIDTQIRIVI